MGDITSNSARRWYLDDSQGNTNIRAQVGSANGVLAGAGNTSASRTTGPGGGVPYAMALDGSNDYIDFGNIEDHLHSDAISFCIRYKWNTTSPTAVQFLISKQQGSGSFVGYYLFRDGTATGDPFTFGYWSGAAGKEAQFPCPNDTNWHTLVAVNSGAAGSASLSLYIDGVAQTRTSTVNGTPGSTSNSVPLQVGARNGSTVGPITVEAFRIFSRARASGDASDWHASSLPSISPWSLVAESQAAAADGGISVLSTSAVDSRTATTGFAWLASTSSVAAPTIYDNYGNYWQVYFNQTHSGGMRGTLYTCENPITGAAHTVSVPAVGNSPTIFVRFIKGHRILGMADATAYTATGTTQAFSADNSITPVEANCLAIACSATFAGVSAPTLNPGFSYESYYCNQAGNNAGGGMGVRFHPDTSDINPTWTGGSTGAHVAAVFSFRPQASGDAISSTEFASGRIFQRATTRNAKSVTVSGKYYNTAPTSVEVKFTDWTSGATIQDWTAVGSLSASGGDWSGSIIMPDGAWYKQQARMKNGGGTVLATGQVTSAKVGVGILIGCIGQSNMVRMFDTYGSPSPNDKTRQFGLSGLNWFAMTGDGACVLSTNIAAATGLPVGLLKYAIAGCGLVYNAGFGEWQTTGTNQARTVFLDGITASGGDLEAVLFFGTEADTFGASTSAAGIQAGYESLYSDVRTLTGRSQSTQRFGASILGPVTSGTAQRTLDIRQGTVNFSTANAGGFIAADARSMPIAAGDSPHYTGPGYILMGQQASQNYLREIGIASDGTPASAMTLSLSLSI